MISYPVEIYSLLVMACSLIAKETYRMELLELLMGDFDWVPNLLIRAFTTIAEIIFELGGEVLEWVLRDKRKD